MFTFLNSFLAWALAAAAIPILIHLFTRKKLKVVPFSTLRFLKAMQREKIRQIRLRQWLLLLVRVLMIAFLVMAFMRPTLRELHLGVGERAQTSAVLLVDNSLSMGQSYRGRSRLSVAITKAGEIMEQMKSGDEITVITAARPAALVNQNPAVDPTTALSLLPRIQQTEASTDMSSAVSLALQRLLSSTALNRELYLLSDNRFSLQDAGFDGSLPATLSVFTLEWPQEKVRNLALTGLSIRNQIFDLGKVVEVEVRVENTGDYDEHGRLLYLLLNGKRVAQQQVEVPAGQARDVLLRVVPETPGYQLLEARLENDQNPLDNHRYAVFSIPERLRVLIAGPQESDRMYVRLALTADTDHGTLLVEEVGLRNLQGADLSRYEAVFLCNVPNIDVELARRLERYVRNGGGLVFFLGQDVDLRNYNESLFARFQLGRIGETIGNPTENDQVLRFGAIRFDHPVFRDIFEKPPDPNRMDSPAFRFAVQVHPDKEADVLVRYSNGAPYLLERRYGAGTVLAFIGAANPEWSDITFKGIFVPMVYRTARYVAAQAERPARAITAGETTQISLQGGKWKQFSLRTPQQTEDRLAPRIQSDRYVVTIEQTQQTGFYQLLADGEVKYVLAVNIPTDEVQQKPAPLEMLRSAFPNATVVSLPVDSELEGILQRLRYGKELWKVFLLVALGLYIIETLLSRESEETEGGETAFVRHHA